jgi:hypothetical protein
MCIILHFILCFIVHKGKEDEMGGACSTKGGEEERTYVVGGKARGWWLDNIRMDLVEVGWGDVDWIGLA